MVTVTWHLLLLIVLVVLAFCVAVTRGTKGYFGSPRAISLVCWGVGSAILFLIYGGFVWW